MARFEISRTARFDPETDRMLLALAQAHDGDLSMTLRFAVRTAAAVQQQVGRQVEHNQQKLAAR